MKAKIIIISILIALSGICKAQDHFFDKYVDMENVTSVSISKAMFSLASNFMKDDVSMNGLLDGAEKLLILSTKDKKIRKRMEKDFSKLNLKGYEKLLRVREKNSKVNFFGKIENKKISNIIMECAEDTEYTLIIFLGTFDMDAVAKLSKNTKIIKK